MIDLMGVKLPSGGHAILLTATIGGAHTDINNQKRTIVYTDCFSEGLAIDMPVEEFYTLWMTCLVTDYELVDVEEEEEAVVGPLH